MNALHISVIAFFCLSPLSALSKELRVVDRFGLTRLVADVENSTQIEVRVDRKENGGEQIVAKLIHLDGLSQEKVQVINTKGIARFSEVVGGVWRIEVEPERYSVKRVSLDTKQRGLGK